MVKQSSDRSRGQINSINKYIREFKYYKSTVFFHFTEIIFNKGFVEMTVFSVKYLKTLNKAASVNLNCPCDQAAAAVFSPVTTVIIVSVVVVARVLIGHIPLKKK